MASLDVLRLLVGAGFLLCAAVLDWRTRRVPNNVWIALAALGLLLFLSDWLVVHRLGWVHLIVAAGVAALAYALWFFHLMAGGADAKAIMALGILLPHSIEWTVLGRDLPLWTSPTPGAIVVLANSVFLFALAPVLLFVVNAARGHFRMPAMFLGYTMDIDKAEASFVWVVDQVDAEGRRRQVLFPSRVSEQAYVANLARLREAGVVRVWVTPKLPFMVPLLIGFVAAFTIGDVLFQMVESLVLRLRG